MGKLDNLMKGMSVSVKQKSIKRNMIMNIILTCSNLIFPLITYSYVTRTLTAESIGKVAFTLSILSYFIYLATLGIPTYGAREAAKLRDNKEKLSNLVKELITINVISTIFSYIILFFCILFVPELNANKSLFLVMSITIMLNSFGLEWLYSALEEYSYITIRSLIVKTIYVPLVFLLIRNNDDYMWYGFLSIFVTSANYILNFINARKYITFKKSGKMNLRKHFKPILILFSATVIINIYNNFDLSMIGFMLSPNSVGLYSTAIKIKNIILSISTAITAVLIPRVSYYISQNQMDKVKKLLLKSFQLSMLLILPIIFYCIMYAENVITFLCGSDYLPAINSLRVLLICIVPIIISNLLGNQLMIPLGMEKQFSKSVFVGLIINLVLNYIFISKIGIIGAAIATLITEVWNMIYMSIKTKKYFREIIKSSRIFIYISGILISSITSYLIYLKISYVGLFYQLAITGIVFFFIYYLVLYIFKEENLTKELLKLKGKIKNEKVKKNS